MRLTALCLLLLVFSGSAAQLVEPILFKEKIHDFGEIVEAAGPAEHEFTFTNTSTRPIKILSVQASCGCTTPGWSKDLIAPGQSGFIKASFDPKGRPGYFNKTLSVTTDFDRNPIVLQIKGSVVDKLSGAAVLTASNGQLRFRNNSFNLGKIYVNKAVEPKEFTVQNAGTEEIKFTKVVAPDYLKVSVPERLKAGEQGTLKIAYDTKARSQYGFLSDRIEVVTTDTENPVKSFSVYATAEEYFPALTPEEVAKAPALLVDKYEADFARVKQGSNVNQESILTNRGKQNLELRFVQSNCTCLTVVVDKHMLKPGESTTLRWTLSTAGRIGTQNKAITIYSNDPRNPVQRITISGFIESQ